MIQELTNLGKYKLMFFPNFSTSYVDDISMEKMEEVEDKNDENIEILNCYAASKSRRLFNSQQVYLENLLESKGLDECPLSLSYFSKILRFLKISSGTYNLQHYF